MGVLATVLLFFSGCATVEAPAPVKPNIILIVADDQGYGDVGAYGSDLPTPHIDSIAQAGVRFTDGYVSGPTCVPSRCGLLTGRYQDRFGCTGRFNGMSLPQTERTLAEYLQARGYSTGMIGKWHLGSDPGQRPTDRGFDEFFGFLKGIHLYYPPERSRDTAFYDLAVKAGGPLYRGSSVVEEESYLTEAFAREAVSFVERHDDGPFLLYLSFNAVHVPLQAPTEYIDRFSHIGNPRRRTLAAMNSAMDDAVGKVLDAVRTRGLEEQTLIFYISDNGGYRANASGNGPLRGEKGQLYEGGIRVPYLAQWKGVIPAGETFEHPVISLDIAATALAVSGDYLGLQPAIDGVNLLPHLRGRNPEQPHDALFWVTLDQGALRKGDWKLVRQGQDNSLELFNLRKDIGEKTNLARERPDIAIEMLGQLEEFDNNIRGNDLSRGAGRKRPLQ